tara:strand:- start:443 stop:1723 length:1281 start_codon:yes stop_codon:yes gene_type:complete
MNSAPEKFNKDELAKLYTEGKYKELEERCLSLQEEYPGDLILENYEGVSFVARGMFLEAEEKFSNLLVKNPESTNFYINLSYVQMQLKKFKDSIESCLEALKYDKNNAVIYYNLGSSYLEENANESAIEHLEKAIHLYGKPFPSAHINLSTAYRNSGLGSKADEHLTIAADLNPENETVQKASASMIASKGNLYDGLSIINKIEGYIILNRDKTPSIDELKIKRLSSNEISNTENFIGSWEMEKEICEKIVTFFESQKDLQRVGTMGWGTQGMPDTNQKDSIDITVYPSQFSKNEYECFDPFIAQIQSMYFDYIRKYEQEKYMLDFDVQISGFNIQKYNEKGHYNRIHCERDSIGASHKLLAWMTYLNDVKDGGETVFVNQKLEVKPQIGKTLIWPADWTHTHYAKEVTEGNKYIATGWVDFSIQQ